MKLKLLQETLLLLIFLHYEVRKSQKMTKGPSFGTACGVLTCLLNLRPRYSEIAGVFSKIKKQSARSKG